MSKTIYADVFATMMIDNKHLMIPMVNEAFEESYTGEEEVLLAHEEHYLKKPKEKTEKRISDSHFISGRISTT